MAPNIKITRAYKAMKVFGFSSQIVKPVLKNLLELYDQNWELIEDEQYKILLEAVIESEECKGDQKKDQESHLLGKLKEDKDNMKLVRAYNTMKTLGFSQQAVEPVLKSLLDLYDQNWQLIEDDQYKVLVDGILGNEGSKGERKKPLRLDTSDEHREDKPLGRRYPLRSRTLQTSSSSSSSGHSSLRFNEAANKVPGFHGKRKLTDSTCHLGDTIIEAKDISVQKDHQKVENVGFRNCYSELELNERIELLPGESIDESGPESAEILHTNNADNDYFGSHVPEKVINNAKRTNTLSRAEKNVNHGSNLLKPKDDLKKYHAADTRKTEQTTDEHSESEAPLSFLPVACYLSVKDGCANADVSSPGGHCLECKCLALAGEKNHTLRPSQLDIASFSNGEVSFGSNFCTPSLDAVSRRMEEDFFESYELKKLGFSKFTNDVCECFLAAGAVGTENDRVRPGNIIPGLGITKKFDTEDVSNAAVNHEKGLHIAADFSLEVIKVKNLFKVVPQIPRLQLQGGNCVDLSCCKIDLRLSSAYRNALANLSPLTSRSLTIVKKQNISHDMLSFTYYNVEDITRGEEDLKVPLINEFNNECQPNFKYIPRNIIHRNAYVKFPLARISDDNCCPNCSGDCLSSEMACACASETGGDFAYSPGGLVKDKFLEDCILGTCNPQQKNLFYCEDYPLDRFKNRGLSGKCKGHLLRKFIKECWYKCGCGMECGNRVVQRGIKVKLQVFMTPEGKGWGLRTLEDLPKGAFVCEYVGEVVTNMELYEHNSRNTGEKYRYPVLLDADWGVEGVLKDEEALCLDATFYGNVARFINHRCYDANLLEIPVEVETPDHHYYHLAFFTRRKINAFEELTWDYGIDFDDATQPVKAFQCSCGSQFCRDEKPLKRHRTE